MPYYIVSENDRSDLRKGPYSSRREANRHLDEGERVIASSKWREP